MFWQHLIQTSQILALCMLALAGAPYQASASNDVNEPLCPISLDDAITLEREQLEKLYRARGLPYDFTRNLAADLQTSVEWYLSHRQDGSDGRPRALLFFIGNAETLCVMFWRVGDAPTANIFIIERLVESPASIVPLIDEMVLGMQDGDAGELREATLRGATSLGKRGSRTASDILGDLSRLLFPGEIASHVSDLSSLSIIPCLNIGVVPFSALDPDRDGVPFVETTVINIEADLRHIQQQRAFGWGSIEAPVIFGDPDAMTDADWSFPRLPGARREATAVAAQLGATAVLGDAVTPDRVMKAIREADYVHIAAHGLSSAQDPLDGSFLALTGGRLTARQIQQTALQRTPLVVLSACQSGLGAPLDAGIIGLARGFMIAGAAGTLATLWNVDDNATEAIMVEFVSNLSTMSPGLALREAQKSARQRYEHPRYWAGFMLFGSRIVQG